VLSRQQYLYRVSLHHPQQQRRRQQQQQQQVSTGVLSSGPSCQLGHSSGTSAGRDQHTAAAAAVLTHLEASHVAWQVSTVHLMQQQEGSTLQLHSGHYMHASQRECSLTMSHLHTACEV
jgi:hypothetical protein